MKRNPFSAFPLALLSLWMIAWLALGRSPLPSAAQEITAGTPAFVPVVHKNSHAVEVTPSPTATPTQQAAASTLYLWSDGLLESTASNLVFQGHTCYAACRKALRWDASLMGDLTGSSYALFGLFAFESVRSYTVPFRIILARQGMEQVMVEYVLSGSGRMELTGVEWTGPDPATQLGDSLIFEIDISGEIGSLDIAYLGEASGIRFPAGPHSPADSLFRNLYALSGKADAIHVCDVDGDGDLDVIGSDSSDRNVNWWENNGSQVFTRRLVEDNLAIPSSNAVHAGDMDGDLDEDLLAIIESSNKQEVAWFENDGSENFTMHKLETNFANPQSIRAVDLDGDGDRDVLVGGYRLDWLRNDGAGIFARQAIYSPSGTLSSVSALDLDEDGDLDILGATISGWLYWYQNDGGQNFTRQTLRTGSSTTTGGRSWVEGADLDGDGDLDVLGTAALDDEIGWWENGGSQDFTPHILSYGLDNPASVTAADLNGDGRLDVLAGGAALAWWENLGNRLFVRHTISSSNVNSLQAVDLDQDGDADFIKSNDQLTWYRNPTR